MLHGYVDLPDFDTMKLFIGAGAGIAKTSGETKITNLVDNKIVEEKKVKSKQSFAYAVHAGVSAEFMPGTHGELLYSYRSFTKVTAGAETRNNPYYLGGHHTAISIRFDL